MTPQLTCNMAVSASTLRYRRTGADRRAVIGRLRQSTWLVLGALALAASSVACASTGAVPKPFPMPATTPHEPLEGSHAATPEPAPAPAQPPSSPAAGGPTTRTSLDRYALVGTALSLRGTPYRNGGADPGGFDCSGFTRYVFAQYGVSLPRAVQDQYRVGKSVTPDELSPGDIVFFTTTEPGPSHVAIAIGGDEFVHAPSSTGVVRVERLSSSYWSPRFLGARRVN